MVSQVRPRPNHYEVLGIDPGASETQIKRAFASRMSLFGAHRPGDTPRIATAFETLRDPARRREYDRSIGLNAEPRAEPRQWGFAVPPPRWTPFVAAPSASEARPPDPAPEPQIVETPTVETPADPRLAAIAASMRELAKPAAAAARPDPTPRPRPAQQPEPQPAFEVELFEQLRAAGSPGEQSPSPYRINWRRPGLAIGGLLAGAGIIGTLAGLSVKDNAEAAQAEPALSVALPAAKPQAVAQPVTVPTAAPAPAIGARPKANVSPRRPSRWAEQMAASLSQAPAAEEVAAVDSATEEQPATLVAASMPLPNPVIARTIERIGYACGSVASTAPAGAPGVFTVNCTSGQAYQAKPVRGRYHFRRIGGR